MVLTGDAITHFQLLAWRGAVKLEALGMTRHGRSATAIVRDHFKMKKGTPRDKVLERLNEEIAKSEQARTQN